MDYTQVMSEIKKGQFRPVYLLAGEEVFLARQVEKALVEALLLPEDRDMSLASFDRDPSAAELATLIETVPFMGGKSVIVVRGTQLFRAGRKAGAEGEDAPDPVDDRLLRLLADIPAYTHLIFMTADKADKRRKIYKAVEQSGAVVDLGALKSKDVRPWVMAKLTELGRKMAPDALDHLLAAVSLMPQISLGFLDTEIEKLALYAKGATISRTELIEIMSAVPEVSVFAMIEALSQKQTGRALKLLEEQLSAGENALRLLALLARQVRLLWRSSELAGRGLNSGQIAEQMGVPPFVGEKLMRQSRAFTPDKMKETIKAMADADWDLKSGRTDKFVLERIIIEMCR